ncbi:transcriptional regulator, SARP family protein [Saccharothrix sp. ALI-22-I]|uniref:AfsR/SARP family transcriptional regulator n=1 Tax=Saccharothrix sp. ALI-22-I TaxID=1933778 RepID=UPI00097C7AFC|nr:BTAD domain-containing putative transcriptional regulator [Saccharothrix sp. ALI-22-I]ONI91392.1 transcriptional regulator, SARP family protein [Saccharothrix sp. ALI-22-I]
MDELRVLGTVQAWAGGRRVEVGHARQQCVLVALAVDANRVVDADQLLDRAWGERIPLRGRETLYTYLSRLRRALSEVRDVTIVRRSGGWELRVDPDAVDLHRFHRLLAHARGTPDPVAGSVAVEQALALWRGEPFTGLDTPWISSVRESLGQQRRAAELDHTDLALQAGRHTELLPALAARAGEHPLDERAAAQYLLALYRCGRQADALTHYQTVRERLAQELGADPGPDLQALHHRILTADATLTVTEPAPAVQHPVPRQLPSAPPHFTGRVAELAALTTTLDAAADHAATVVVSAIAGAGGIGKTWLALHWAHRHADRFPDGQLFVDLRGFSPEGEPMDPAVAVRGFLDALGVDPGRIPVDPHAQAALFRSLVADRRMLLVLDNAADTTQVIPLLPGSRSCTVVVTSRDRLPGLITGHGARHLALHILDDAEARDLLTTRLGAARVQAEPDAVGELVRLCGGFPLALSIIAGRAHTHPHLSLAAIADELRDSGLDALDDGDPAASLPAVLSWSHQALTADQATTFALLGIAPGADIGLPAAASLVGLALNDTRTVLRALEQASLINQDAPGRYRLHDLIRRYATTTAHDLAEEVREAALARVLDFYTHTAHAADRLLYPHRLPAQLGTPGPGTRHHPLPDVPAALAWFDTEHPNLLAAQRTAAAHAQHHAVWRVAWTLSTFHTRRGHHHDELDVWLAALNAAAHLPDPTTHTVTHRYLGGAYTNLGRHREATEHLHQALALAEHHHDVLHQGHIRFYLAWASERRGDYRQALEHARRVLDLPWTHDQPVWKADALNQVGWHAARLGEYDTARTHCQAALTVHRRHHNPIGEAHALGNLGYIDHHTGRHERALDHYGQSLVLLRRAGDISNEAITLDWAGQAHTALGRHDQARAVWREALELCRRQGRHDDAERVRRQLDELSGSSATDNPPAQAAHPIRR